MTVGKLIELEKAGVFKVGEDMSGKVFIGGQPANKEELKNFLKNMGWTEWLDTEVNMVKQTSKLARDFKRYVKNEAVLQSTLEMKSSRLTESFVTTYVVKLRGNDFNASILIGYKGLGGKYTMFHKEKSETQSVACGSSMKSLEYELNRLDEEVCTPNYRVKKKQTA